MSGSLFHAVIGDRVYLASVSEAKKIMSSVHRDEYHMFETSELEYIPFCHDFGPFSLGDAHRFVNIIQSKIARYPGKKIVYCVSDEPTQITNGVFLLGCYMVMILRLSPEAVSSAFEDISSLLMPYRDAGLDDSDFQLPVESCWRALHRYSALTVPEIGGAHPHSLQSGCVGLGGCIRHGRVHALRQRAGGRPARHHPGPVDKLSARAAAAQALCW